MFQFSFASSAVTTALILTLVASNQRFYKGSYRRLDPDYSYSYLQTSPAEKFFSTPCLLKCVTISLISGSEFFSYNKMSNVCMNYPPKTLMTVVRLKDKNEVSFYKNREWIKVYAISMGANSLIYNSFLNIGNVSTWNVDKCNGVYCPNFFRHPILDIWEKLPIKKVAFQIYKRNVSKPVVTMMFDGRKTNLENWFSVNNMRSSPWDDLVEADVKNFSLFGVGNRSSFNVSENNENCDNDHGWLTINEAFNDCKWGKSNHFPTILYSDTDSKTHWNNHYETADSMAIFIQLDKN